MIHRWFIAVAALPFPVVVLVPAALLAAFRSSQWAHSFQAPSSPLFWFGLAAAVVGMALVLWSNLVFARHGEGTPAPWAPPALFVAKGPFCYIRNPMILGILLLLLGEALLLRSVPLFGWFSIFCVGNLIYIPLIEEKGLERRFGSTYLQYKKDVPRWFPRRTAWRSMRQAIYEKRGR